MIVSYERRFIFLKSSKAAGTSIELYLSQFCGPQDVLTPFFEPEPEASARNCYGRVRIVPELRFMGSRVLGIEGSGSTPCLLHSHRDRRNRRLFYEAMPAWQLIARMGRPFFDGFTSLAVERNPWDKVISRVDHLNGIGRATTVDTLLDQLERTSQSPFCQLAPLNFPRYADPKTGQVLVSRLIPYETLDAELQILLKELDIPFSGTLPTRAKGQYRDRTRHYRERLTDLQAERIARIFSREIQLMGYVW